MEYCHPTARAIGIETVLTPVHAPKANSLVERVIGTIRRECLDHLIVRNEAHLRRVLHEYLAYYNDARPHQSLALEPPTGSRDLAPRSQRHSVVATPVLGGLHHVYDWAA